MSKMAYILVSSSLCQSLFRLEKRGSVGCSSLNQCQTHETKNYYAFTFDNKNIICISSAGGNVISCLILMPLTQA